MLFVTKGVWIALTSCHHYHPSFQENERPILLWQVIGSAMACIDAEQEASFGMHDLESTNMEATVGSQLEGGSELVCSGIDVCYLSSGAVSWHLGYFLNEDGARRGE